MTHSYDKVAKTLARANHHPHIHAQPGRSEALAQSRALPRKSSLTDLHIACEPAASRDSGTDASQANAAAAAFTAGSVAEQQQQQREDGACSPAGAEDDLSPAAVTR